MIFENTQVNGFEAAFRGMRNPMNSWSKSDSIFGLTSTDWLQNKLEQVCDTYDPQEMSFDYIEKNGIIRQDTETDTYDIALIGNSDMKLAKNLIRAGASDAKFLRQIEVSVDITAPAYWLAELDTYKIATVRNSTSLQHKGMSRDYNLFDFTIDKISLVPKDDNGILCESERDLQTIIDLINKYRQLYKQTKNYTYFRVMRQLIPMGYNYTITFTTNYAVVRNMYQQRHNHRLTEWSVDFCDWVKNLPYANDLLTYNI